MIKVILVFLITMTSLQANTTRLEEEYKFAFTGEKLRGKTINKIQNALKKLLSSKTLSFSKMIEREYYLESNFKNFVFKDYYFDSEDLKLLNSNSAYRLRYRWNNSAFYFRYKLLPLIKTYYPTRCEIQFKNNYQFRGNYKVDVQETRFEFRNESFPFTKHKNAPPPPWPFSTYKEVVKQGKYRGYPIKPYTEAIKILENDKIKHILTTETIRVRNHINIKNPFGSGPNPEQAFIITFDFSEGIYKNNKTSFVEVEIELERNISTLLNKSIKYIGNDPIKKEASEFAKTIKATINEDFKIIKETILKILQKEVGPPLRETFKYKRFMSVLKN